jgi:hypothetical protein
MADEEETREALVEKLREHVAASADGAYLTDFVILAAAAMPADPDATTYITETSDGPLHHRLGLVRYLSLRCDGMMTGDDDD